MEKIARSIPVTRPYKLPLKSNKWGGAHFSGTTGSYITIGVVGNLNNLSQCSLVARIKPLFIPLIDSSILGKGGRRNFAVGLNGGIPTVAFSRAFTGTNGYWWAGGGILKAYNEYHIAITYDDSNINNKPIMYIDGISQIVTISSAPAGTPSSETGNLTLIGYQGYGTSYFNGPITDVAYINGILTQSQIQDLMYGRILPTQFDCRLWHDYRLDHARDLSGNGNHGTLNGNVRFV